MSECALATLKLLKHTNGSEPLTSMSNVQNTKIVSKHKYYTGMVKSVVHQYCIKTNITLAW